MAELQERAAAALADMDLDDGVLQWRELVALMEAHMTALDEAKTLTDRLEPSSVHDDLRKIESMLDEASFYLGRAMARTVFDKPRLKRVEGASTRKDEGPPLDAPSDLSAESGLVTPSTSDTRPAR